MPTRLKVGAKTVDEVFAKAGIDIDPQQVNGVEVVQALIDRLRAPSPFAIVPVPIPASAFHGMSAMLPAMSAHLPFSTPVPDEHRQWYEAVHRESMAALTGKDGKFNIEVSVSNGVVTDRQTSRTEY